MKIIITALKIIIFLVIWVIQMTILIYFTMEFYGDLRPNPSIAIGGLTSLYLSYIFVKKLNISKFLISFKRSHKKESRKIDTAELTIEKSTNNILSTPAKPTLNFGTNVKGNMNLKRKKFIAREFLIIISCALVYILTYIGTYPFNYILESRIAKTEISYQTLTDNIISQSRLSKLYILYLENDIISTLTSLKDFANANDAQKRRLFIEGKEKYLFNTNTFTNRQLYKDFLETLKQNNYDYDVVMPRFPELVDIDLQLLKDYTTTAIKYNYDYDVINPLFPELFVPITEVKKSDFDNIWVMTPDEEKNFSFLISDAVEKKMRDLKNSIQAKKIWLVHNDSQRKDISLPVAIVFFLITFPLRYFFYAIRLSLKILKQKE